MISLAERNKLINGVPLKHKLRVLHRKIELRLTQSKPNVCPKCKESKKLELSNISGKYNEDLYDWQWLCRPCHRAYDSKTRTHCRNGHELTKDNIVIKSRGLRICRICRNANFMRWYNKHRKKKYLEKFL